MTIRGQFEEAFSEPPPEGWERGHVTLKLRHPEESVPVEAWRRGAFAVHPLAHGHGGKLSHAPTGLGIWSADSMKQAAELALAIEPLADWTAFAEQIPAGGNLYRSVRNIINRFDRNDAD